MRYIFVLILILFSCGCTDRDHIVNDCEVVSRSKFSQDYTFLESVLFSCPDGIYRCFYAVKAIDCERL